MPKLRFSIAGLMGIVLVVAVGLGGLMSPSPMKAGAIFMMTCGLLGLALVGAIYRRGKQRAWWVGFCVFGWGYLLLVATYGGGKFRFPSLPTSQVLVALGPKIEPDLPSGVALGHDLPPGMVVEPWGYFDKTQSFY